MAVEPNRPFWSRHLSLPNQLACRDENWSPRADRTEQSFDSDEDRDIEMSSPDSFVSARDYQPVHSAFYDSFTNSLSLENKPEAVPLCKASSRSLKVGRPTRSVGLKDVDLSNVPRAEYIRQAKEASRSPKKRHTSAPVRFLSSPALFSIESPSSYYRQTSNSSERPSVSSSPHVSSSPARPVASTPVRDTFSEVEAKTRLPGNTQQRSRGQRAASYHGNNVQLIDLTVEKVQHKSDVIEISGSSQGSDGVDEDVFTSKASDEEYVDERKFRSSNAGLVRHRWHGAMALTKKPSKAPREVRGLCFSDDEDDYECLKKNSKGNHPLAKTQNTQQISCCDLVFRCLLFLLAVVIGFSLYLHHNPHGLCLEGEFKSNLTELERVMMEDLYGQHLARKIIMAALRSHVNQPSRKPLVLSFHGGTGIGKNFVSNLIAKHLFKRGYQSQFVHKIIIPLHFPHKSEVERYSRQLSGWITRNVSQCSKRALFIFDEMDKIPKHLIDTLRPFLNHRGLKSSVDLRGSIFLFLSNSGGNAINQFAWKHYHQGKDREEISLPHLEGILHKMAEQNAEVWYGEILRSELIDHFVPFLPLERAHVKECIRQDLREKGLSVEERVVTEIADQMTYFPADFEVFSASGCKKVSSKVDVGTN